MRNIVRVCAMRCLHRVANACEKLAILLESVANRCDDMWWKLKHENYE